MTLSPINKHTVLKITRTQGKWEGFIAPNKVNWYHVTGEGWNLGMNITVEYIVNEESPDDVYWVKGQDDDYHTLDSFLSSFSYYNCCSEVGTRIRFWEVN